MYVVLGWGSIQDGVILFQYSFLTGVLIIFWLGGVVIKTGALIELIRYTDVNTHVDLMFDFLEILAVFLLPQMPTYL